MLSNHFPRHLTPRPQQAAILKRIEEIWDTSDVLVLLCPTATGKTEIAYTLAHWAASRGQTSNILVPSNVLVDQALERYPALTALHRKAAYECRDSAHALDCDCQHARALGRAKKARVRLMNYWTYLANAKRGIYAPVAIFDEGHQIIDMLRGMQDLKLWQSQYKFPKDLKIVGDLIEWGQEHLRTHDDEKLSEALRRIALVHPNSSVVYHRKSLRKRPDVLLSIEASSVEPSARYLWPDGRVRKIVLMSATTGPQDVKELGLNGRRVVYLECESPIPASQRPLLYKPSYNAGHKYVDKALPTIVRKIEELLAAHPDKGLIHMPYALAAKLQAACDHPRLLFHTQRNKAKVLGAFRASDPAEGKVLVASGLYEGVDLPYDAARWQLIGKVPFLSLADPWIKQRAGEDPGWYAWSTIKKVIQAYGRIVRAADDFGCTYIMDDNFGRLLSQNRHMFPQFILDAIKTETRR